MYADSKEIVKIMMEGMQATTSITTTKSDRRKFKGYLMPSIINSPSSNIVVAQVRKNCRPYNHIH